MLLAAAMLTGLAAAGLTFVVRAVIDTANPLWLMNKPFSCDLCMNWWASLALVVIDLPFSVGECAQLVLASTAVGVVTVKVANRLSD